MRGIDSVEKAENIVRSVCIWIDAGYSDAKSIQKATDALRVTQSDVIDEHAPADVLAVLENAITSLEASTEPETEGRDRKKSKIEVEIDGKYEEAKEKVRSGDRIDVVRLLTSVLLTAKYKPFLLKHPDFKSKLVSLRDAVRDGKDLTDHGL